MRTVSAIVAPKGTVLKSTAGSVTVQARVAVPIKRVDKGMQRIHGNRSGSSMHLLTSVSSVIKCTTAYAHIVSVASR